MPRFLVDPGPETGLDLLLSGAVARHLVIELEAGASFDLRILNAGAAFGRLDCAFNNAGVGDLRPMHTLDDKTWQRLIDVNLAGTFNVMRAAVPILRSGGGGHIVNISAAAAIARHIQVSRDCFGSSLSSRRLRSISKAATKASDPTPKAMATGGRLIRIKKLKRQQPSVKAQACLTLIRPDGIGRPAVRATLASKSRSTMSL